MSNTIELVLSVNDLELLSGELEKTIACRIPKRANTVKIELFQQAAASSAAVKPKIDAALAALVGGKDAEPLVLTLAECRELREQANECFCEASAVLARSTRRFDKTGEEFDRRRIIVETQSQEHSVDLYERLDAAVERAETEFCVAAKVVAR